MSALCQLRIYAPQQTASRALTLTGLSPPAGSYIGGSSCSPSSPAHVGHVTRRTPERGRPTCSIRQPTALAACNANRQLVPTRPVTLDMPAATAVTAENGMAAQVDDTHKCASPWFDAPATRYGVSGTNSPEGIRS
jgi:hypothetical protein